MHTLRTPKDVIGPELGSRAFAGPRERWLRAAETVRLATQGGADVLGLARGGGFRTFQSF